MTNAKSFLLAIALAAGLAPAARAAVTAAPDPLTLAPGQTSGPIQVTLTFPRAVNEDDPQDLLVEFTPPLLGAAETRPRPVTYTIPAGASQAAVSLSLFVPASVPPGSYVVGLRDGSSFGGGTGRLSVRILQPTATLTPSSVALAQGETSPPIRLQVDNLAATSLDYDVLLPAALQGHVTVAPTTVRVGWSRGATSASADFRITAGPQAPAGRHVLDLGNFTFSADGLPVPQPRVQLVLEIRESAVAPRVVSAVTSPEPLPIVAGETSGPVTLSLTLDRPADRTLDYYFVADVQRTAREHVRADPATVRVTVPVGASSATATLRVVTRPDTAAGRYGIWLHERTLPGLEPRITLQVSAAAPVPAPAGDFRLAFTKPGLALCNGGAPAANAVRLQPVQGYTGQPALGFRRLPPGISISPPALTTLPLPPAREVGFEVTAKGAAAGKHTVLLEARDTARNLQRQATFEVIVGAADFAPQADPPALGLVAGGSSEGLTISIGHDDCFPAASVAVSVLGAPQGVQVDPPAANLIGPQFAPVTLRVRALAGATPDTYPLRVRFRATSGAEKTVVVPVTVQGPAPAVVLLQPRVDRVSPSEVEQGKPYTLSLVGRNLALGTALGFGAGIQILAPAQFGSPTNAKVRVFVEPAAQPGPRLATASNQLGSTDGPGYLTVKVPAPQLGPPRVDSVTPPQVERGKKYLLKVEGKNLDAGVDVGFGPGVKLLAPPVAAGAGALALQVEIEPQAGPGSRTATAAGAGGSSTGPGTLQILGDLPAQLPPQVVGVVPWTPTLGKIHLELPAWGDLDLSNFQAGYVQKRGVPALDDALKFEWREENPGTADYFELRVLDAQGAKVVATRRIDPGIKILGVVYPILPAFYRPDAELIAELAAALPVSQSGVGLLKASLAALGGQSPLDAAGRRDFLWEVAGFSLAGAPSGASKAKGGPVKVGNLVKAGNQPHQAAPAGGGAAPKPTGMLVEISDRWPIKLAGRPTGLACPAAGLATAAKLEIENKDASEPSKQGVQDTTIYVGHTLQAGGTLKLTGSPYASHPLPEWPDVWRLDNLFLDWGDGTVVAVQPRNATPFPSGAIALWDDYATLGLPAEPNALQHAFAYPDNYTIRLYQLADADVQKVNLGALAATQDGFKGSSLGVLLASLGRGKSTPAASDAPGAIAGRAYMLACTTRTIQPRLDPCARGPLRLASIDITAFPGHEPPKGSPGDVVLNPKLTGAKKVSAVATDCDESFTARAQLDFFGQGLVEVRFRLDDGTLLKSERREIASKPRTDLGKNSWEWGPPQLSQEFFDVYLPVTQLGQNGVSVEAEVIYDPLAAALGAMLGGGGSQPESCPFDPTQVSNHFPGFDLGGPADPPPANSYQVGTLGPAGFAGVGWLAPASGGPSKVGTGGMAPSWMSLPQPHPSGKKEPPDYVSSGVRYYQVFAKNSANPCFFLFPTQNGTFRLTDLNSKVQLQSNGRYSGQGLLRVPLSTGSDSFGETPVEVGIANWLATNGIDVEDGSFSDQPKKKVKVAGLDLRIDQVSGKVGNTVLATLAASPPNNSLVRPETGWTATEPLSSAGNWFSSGQGLSRTPIGYSGFAIESDDVAIDLARDQGVGAAGAGCGPGGPAWIGIGLGKATLHMMDFGLGSLAAFHPAATGWVFSEGHLCGQQEFSGTSKQAWGTGGSWLSIGGVEARAGGGMFEAWYNNFELFSPWVGKPLDPVKVQLFDSGQSGKDAKGAKIPQLGSGALQDWGTIAMLATDLRLVQEGGVGWALNGTTLWGFKDPAGKPFATFETDQLFFRMADGRAYFPKAATQHTLGLKGVKQSKPPHLGDTPVDLVSVQMSSGLPDPDRLGFSFETLLRLSAAEELPDPTTRVDFRLARQGAGFSASHPKTAPFKLVAEFPLGSPTIKAGIDPHYEHGSTKFCGKLDMSLLGGKGLSAGTGTFFLGYDKGLDGWLAHYKVPVGGKSGIPIAPPLPVNLFSIEGGLAYNIAAANGYAPGQGTNPFANPVSCAAPLVAADTGPIFAAGMVVGTTDGSTLTGRGMLSVSKAFGTRLDIDAWLLDPNPSTSGPGDIEGVLKWQNGAFNGKFWGGLEFLEDPTGIIGGHVVELDLGSGEGSAAIDLLFSTSGEWHVWAGSNPQNKGGTPVQGKVLFADSKAWLMLGGQGAAIDLDVGGEQKFDVRGCIWKCCAEVYAAVGCGFQMSTSPPKVGGSANAKFGVKLCGVGFSISGKASLGCCAPYANVQLCADVVPCIKCGGSGCWPNLCEACAGFSL